jgi:hypothetical protein
VKKLLGQALELPPDEQERFVERAMSVVHARSGWLKLNGRKPMQL